jgi:hypothetical protein
MAIRLLAAVAALVSAAVHLGMGFNGVREEPGIGPLFLLNAVAGVVIAVLLVTWKHWVPFFLVFGLGACTLGAFTIAATVGLFGLHEHWEGNLVWTAAIAEAVAIVTGLVGLWREAPRVRRPVRERVTASSRPR